MNCMCSDPECRVSGCKAVRLGGGIVKMGPGFFMTGQPYGGLTTKTIWTFPKEKKMQNRRPRVVRWTDTANGTAFLEIVDVLHHPKGARVQNELLTVMGDDLDDLREQLEQMLACLGEPAIEVEAT